MQLFDDDSGLRQAIVRSFDHYQTVTIGAEIDGEIDGERESERERERRRGGVVTISW